MFSPGPTLLNALILQHLNIVMIEQLTTDRKNKVLKIGEPTNWNKKPHEARKKHNTNANYSQKEESNDRVN